MKTMKAVVFKGKDRVAVSTVQGQDVTPESPPRLVSLG